METMMRGTLTLNRFAVALSVLAVAAAAYLALPLFSNFWSEPPIAGDPLVKTVAELAFLRQQDAHPSVLDGEREASRQRIQQMEAELNAVQSQAAKNPNRPTVAEMERELNRMAARHGESDVSRLERLVKGSLGLSLALALSLTGLAVSNLKRMKSGSAAA
jgi:hypothetical protein